MSRLAWRPSASAAERAVEPLHVRLLRGTPTAMAGFTRPFAISLVLSSLLVGGCTQSPAPEAPEGLSGVEDQQQQKRQAAERLVLDFWATVWNPPHDLSQVDEFCTEDFVLTSAGSRIEGREAFQDWIAQAQAQLGQVELDPNDTFASADATRVTSRWTVRTRPGDANAESVEFTGIAVWQVRWTAAGPRLARNWVERSAWEPLSDLGTETPDGLETIRSAYDVPTTVARVKAAAEKRGFSVLATFDHAGAAQNADLALAPTTVVVFGKPKAGTQLMQKEPTVALDLPLHVLVWTRAGETAISYDQPSYLAERYQLEHPVFEKMEAALSAIAEEAGNP